MSPLIFPLKKNVELSADPDGFKGLDLRSATHLPMAPHPGSFAFERANHVHEGVDLYGVEGEEVFAMEPGRVVFVGPFTGPAAGSPWWLDTSACAIEGDSGVIFYGEIADCPLAVGDLARAGDLVGRLSRVLKNDKGRPLHMLHVELYKKGARQSCGVWAKGAERPAGLLDPTPLLAAAAGLFELPQPSQARKPG